MDRDEANRRIKRINIRGKQYAGVNQRILAFWEIYPNGSLLTEMLSDNDERCVFKATAMDGDRPLATGHAFEIKTASNINKTSYIENCETSAVGRALGMLGIGAEDAICSAEEVQSAMSQQEEPKKYKAPVKPKPEDEACPEWHAMVKAVSDYVEITGEPKKDVWERWGKSVGKRDAEMCLAVVADIERALNG